MSEEEADITPDHWAQKEQEERLLEIYARLYPLCLGLDGCWESAARRALEGARVALAHFKAETETAAVQPLKLLEDTVWCERHGCIHDDSLNPYGLEELCQLEDHRYLYIKVTS